jgi:hypothetical protein
MAPHSEGVTHFCSRDSGNLETHSQAGNQASVVRRVGSPEGGRLQGGMGGVQLSAERDLSFRLPPASGCGQLSCILRSPAHRTSLPASTRCVVRRRGSLASWASSAGARGDRHLDASVHCLDRAHQSVKPDVSGLASFKLGNDRLLHAQFCGELALRQAAGVSQGDELLFNAHRLQFRLDGGREIRVVLGALVDGSNGTVGERHDYRPFFGSLSSA